MDWVLHDCFAVVDSVDAVPPGMVITSAEELRLRLVHFSKMKPRILVLENPNGETLQIGIGGPVAGAAVFHDEYYGKIMSPKPISTSSVDFLYHAQPCRLTPTFLFPVEDFIELLLEYYQSGSLPTWVIINK